MFEILSLAVGGIITACLSYMIEVFMRQGMIFERYYIWLVHFHASRFEEYENLQFNDADLHQYENLASDSFWFKPMGGCATCMNVWLCFFSFPVVCVWFDFWFGWWIPILFIAYVGISNAFLRKFFNE